MASSRRAARSDRLKSCAPFATTYSSPIQETWAEECGAEFATFSVKDQKWTPKRANEELSTMSDQALRE